MKLQSVSVKESVNFHGPADTTLLCANGELEFDEACRCIVAKPFNASKPLIMVPLENVRSMIPMTEALAEAEAKKRAAGNINGLVGQLTPERIKEREAAAEARRAEQAKVPEKAGVVKFERGPDGKPVETTV